MSRVKLLLVPFLFLCSLLLHYDVFRNNSRSAKKMYAQEEAIFNQKFSEGESLKNQQRKFPILYWTKMFNREDFYLGLGSLVFENCPFSNCYADYNQSRMPVENYAAVLFHDRDLFGVKLPQRRSPKQYYIYSNLEPPVYSDMIVTNNFYNLTMSYRLDSDIIRPYGTYSPIKTKYELPSSESVANRTGKISWMVSRCDSSGKRELIASKINESIPIDVIGKCSKNNKIICPRKDDAHCLDILEKNYKFYLSFENSACVDYVTEKLYKILNRNLVPIVYGGADYSKFAPPYSIINIRDFESIEDLVGYLQILDENPELYLNYFKWKSEYVIDTSNNQVLCNLCKKLNEPIEYKVYPNIRTWYSNNACTYQNKYIKEARKS